VGALAGRLTGEQPIPGCRPRYLDVDRDCVVFSMLTDGLRAVDQNQSKHPLPMNCSTCHATLVARFETLAKLGGVYRQCEVKTWGTPGRNLRGFIFGKVQLFMLGFFIIILRYNYLNRTMGHGILLLLI
jgi:hypothetical protein